MDDFGDTPGTAGAIITLNTPVDGDIESPNDTDWFAVALEAGKQYRVQVLGDSSNNGSLNDPLLSGIYDATSALVADTTDDDGGTGLDSELLFSPAADGTYYIEASAFNQTTGSYAVNVEELGGSTFSLAGNSFQVTEGDTGPAAFALTVIREGDLSAAASVSWSVSGLGTSPAEGSDFVGGALPAGVLNFAADQVSQDITINIAGDLVVEDDEQFSVSLNSPTGNATVDTGSKLGLIVDDDAPSDSGSALLAIGGGTIADFEGQAGTTAFNFTVTRSGNTAIAASASWTVGPANAGDSADAADFDGGLFPSGMVMFDIGEIAKPVTVLVAGDTDPESDEVFAITLSDPGAQTVITSASKLATILDDEADDYGQSVDDAGSIGLGLSKTGSIETGSDEDWFELALLAGNTYTIDLQGAASGDGTLADPLINGVYDSLGNLIPGTVASDGGSGANARLLFTPDTDGTYYIAAAPNADAGTYTLSVNLETNSPPAGTLVVEGQPVEGQTLTASDTLTDADGLGDFSYQWFADDVTIAGATASTFQPTQAEVGRAISVRISYLDGGGTQESVTSDGTTAVINVNNAPTGEVTIVGEATVGGLLTATDTLADVDGLGTLTYQWYRDGQALNGETDATFAPTLADKGSVITVIVSYTDDQGTAESVAGDAAGPVNNAGDLVEGTTGPDTLTGGDRDDTLTGFAGDDLLEGLGGDDEFRGGAGLDTAKYAGLLADFSVISDSGIIAVSSSTTGNDQLTGVERLRFDDSSVAYDLGAGESAGNSVKLLGAMLGASGAADTTLRGIGIDLFDNAGLSFEQVMDIALEAVLGPGPSNADVVNLLWGSLIGGPTPQDLLNDLVGALDSGALTQSGLAVAAAEIDINLDNIGLVGLLETGLEYLPV